MKDGIITAITTLCVISLCLWLFSTLVPLYAEWSGQAERDLKAKLDAESCASYTPLYINNVLFCQCSDTESQKSGKCNEKYK